MHHQTVGPGSVLAGRYRVEDLLAETADVRCWLAIDEVLARSVAVHVLPAGNPRAGYVLEAARRASVVPDARFVRVLDAAEDENAGAFVVREWVVGDPLERVLGAGPLPPGRATWIARECAAALTTAHDLGIAHLRVVPSKVLLTSSGGVKVLGLATDAALHNLTSADPAAADVRSVGALLYACLVARWPGESPQGLPPAPLDNGRVLRPRQVRPGVPRALDDLCDRLLNDPGQAGGQQPRTTGELTAALSAALGAGAGAAEPVRSDVTGSPAATATASFPEPGRVQPPAAAPQPRRADTPTAEGASVTPGLERASRRPDRRKRIVLWVAVVALFVGASVLGYELGRRGADGDGTTNPGPSPTATTGQPSPPPAAAQPLAIAEVTDFDPVVDGGSGEENSDQAPLAVDDDAATAWETDRYYNSPQLSGLKPGVGLLVDLGNPAEVREVRLSLVGTGTAVELRAAPPGAAEPPESADGFRTVATAPNAGQRAALRPTEPVTTRYLLVYLTSLPEDSLGGYRGRVAEIEVLG